MDFAWREKVEAFLAEQGREEPHYVAARALYGQFGRSRELYSLLSLLDGREDIILRLNDDDIFGLWVCDSLLEKYKQR